MAASPPIARRSIHRSARRFTRSRAILALLAGLLSTVALLAAAGPASAETRPMLRRGSTGEAVTTLEQRLTDLGYDPGTIDTTFDTATRNAVITFQATARIATDGIVGPITWSKLDQGIQAPEPDPPASDPDPDPPRRPMLRRGSTGEAVTTLEQRLTDLGYDPGTIDTTFDTATRNAVITFQATARIATDGIVGPITWSKLDQGIQAPEPDPPADDPDPPADEPDPPADEPDPPADEPDPPADDPDPDGGTLKRGSSGPAIRRLEERLSSLGYWLGTVDDQFDSDTHHAVVALQKAAGLSRDGVVGPNTRAALDAGARPSARTSSGHVLEVDLTRQLLLVVDSGTVVEIFDVSTGKASTATPAGSYTITREIDGYRYAPLGTLYRPKYFNRGIAFHGYPSVPAAPASHGCVRLTYPAMDRLWSSGVAPIDTVVEVYT